MKKRYHLEYEESQQTFADMYQLYYDSRSLYFYKLIITVAGFLILAVQFSINHSIFTVPYVVKFLVLWGLSYAAGYLAVKYIVRRMDSSKAKITGERNYRNRREKCGTDLKVSVDFYEDHFVASFQDKREEYSYKEVSRLLQSEQFFGLVVGGVYGNKAMVGFPASSLDAAEKEEFLSHMAEKCTNVAGGFRRLWC